MPPSRDISLQPKARGDSATSSAGLLTVSRILLVFGPVLALVGFATVLALAAWLFGGYRAELLGAAAGPGVLVVLFASVLLYRQVRQRQAAERAFASAAARVSGIIDSAMDAIITVDESQHIALFNAAAEAMFLCPKDAAIGAPLSLFIPERFRAGHAGHIERFGATGVTSRRMGGLRVVTGLRRNGEEFPIDASISQVSENAQKFYTVILRDVTERARTEEALRQSREELKQLATVASEAREQEKSRIARELHDELAQALTGLKMDVAWIAPRLPAGLEPVAAKLARMETLLDETVAATRRIAADLRPLILDDLGLVPAVEWLVQNFTQRTGIHCRLDIDHTDIELADAHATALFRILQESLTNVAKHAMASHVDVTIEHRDGEILVRVSDDGVGFRAQAPRAPTSRGLAGLRERTHLLSGVATIDSAPGEGTTVEVRLPLPDPTRT